MNRSDLIGSLVGYIVISYKSGKFLPMIGRVIDSPGDDDAFLQQVFTQPGAATLEDAQACFDPATAADLAHVFCHPVSSNMMGMTWLSELTAAETLPPQLVHLEHRGASTS